MPVNYHPRCGQILLCDFSKGFKEPEMVKSKRPVVVITPQMKGRGDLVTVVALSTAEPKPPRPCHCVLPRRSMPQLGRFQEKDTWVKGDMIYTVAFHRLDRIMLGKRDGHGKRLYFDQRLGREQMRKVYSCVLAGLNLGQLALHLE